MAVDGGVALTTLEREPAEVVMVEWCTQDSDAVELCRAIRKRSALAATHVVALIAEGGVEEAPTVLEDGADDYLAEPFEPVEVVTRAQAGLRVARLRESEARLRESEARLRESEARLRTYLSNVSGAVYRGAADSARTIELIGDEIERISGYPPADFVRSAVRTFTSVIHPADRESVERAVIQATIDRPFDVEYRIVRADGDVGWVHERGQVTRAGDGRTSIEGAIFDITDRRRAEAARDEAEERFRQAFDAAPIGMALVAPDGRWLEVNHTLLDITGYAEAELLAKRFQDITHPDDLKAASACVRQLFAGERRKYRLEKRLVRADRHSVWVLVSAAVVGDADGKPLYLVEQIQDISERKRYEGELRHLADHDVLTGLYNRRRFIQEVERQLAHHARYGSEAALVLLDLDNFKDVNDTLGHQVGDELLQAVARALQTRTRTTDVLARLGGDEFALLLPETSEAQARHVADAVVKAVGGATVTVEERQVGVTASAGVVLLDADRDASDFFVEADLALYEAKEVGRDRVAVYGTAGGGQHRERHRLSWLERLRSALEHDRFVLHFQPIVDLTTNTLSQYEALLRLDDPDSGELLEPGAFLYIAERFGMMRAIDRWVVGTALATLGDCLPDVRLEVNLSAPSLSDPDLLALIERELSERSVDPSKLIFEITETDALANLQPAKELARRLTNLGCAFALDDFGSGFSSFYALQQLSYDYIKIDGDFIRRLPVSRDDKLVVRALVDVAHGMGKETIAEFVTDQPTQELLRDYGIDYAQGFHVGRPQPLEDIASVAREGPAEGGSHPPTT